MDADHIGGIDDIIKAGYNINNKVYDNGSPKTTSTITDYRNAASTTTAGSPTRFQPGEFIDLGDGARITCIASRGEVIGIGEISGATESENDMSVVLLIEYGNFDYILGGDLGGGKNDYSCTGRSTAQSNVETSVARAITPDGPTPLLSEEGVDVLHVNHHGSESSTNSDYMNLLKPEVATINVGSGQGYNWYHPRKDVVDNVLFANVPCIEASPVKAVYQTEEGSPFGATTSTSGYAVGDIIITTDGLTEYMISGSGMVSQGPNEVVAAGLPKVYPIDEIGSSDDTGEISLDHILFSEVFYDPKGRREGDKEWIELYNPTLIDIHLNGWKIIDNNGDGSSFEFPKGTTITSKEHLIVARNNKGFKKLYRFNPDIDGLSL
ncbi:MAG: lamin tail domain-containing protein [Candidatus Marinimicrobia bacterium]|nr:lamin tail domain-containing protein [Candidatus Neomarinimicrobiota bacterium]